MNELSPVSRIVRIRVLAVIVLAALIASALPVPAAPNDPTPTSWSPARTQAPVRAIAMAKEARTIGIGTAPITESSTPIIGPFLPSQPSGSDVSAYDLDSGRLFNTTGIAGKVAVAVSRDGKAMAVAGPRIPGSVDSTVTRYTVPTAITAGSYSPQKTALVAGPVAGMAMSTNGARLVVGFNEPLAGSAGGRGTVRMYNDELASIGTFTSTARVTSVAMDDAGRWIVAGGRHVEGGNDTRIFGAVYLFQYPSGSPVRRHVIQPANTSDIKSVDISSDGLTYSALTTAGEVLVFQNREGVTSPPARSGTPTSNATGTAFAMSENGRVLVAGVGSSLVAYRFDGTVVTKLWNTTVPDTVVSLDVNATGDVIVAGVAGASGGALALSPRSSTPFWRMSSGVSNVTVSSDGRAVAFARGNEVHAVRLNTRVGVLFETGPGRGTSTSPPVAAQPFRPVTFNMLVVNEGAIPDRATLVLPVTRDVTFQANRTTFDLLPGESQRVSVVATPGRLSPETYSFNISARARSFVSNTTLSFTVSGTTDLEIALNGAPQRRVTPGTNDTIRLTLTNNGNSAVPVAVDVTQAPSGPESWRVYAIGEREFTLSPGSIGVVQAMVEVPRLATNGSENLVTITLRTPTGPLNTEVRYSVNPFIGVNITVPGRAKFVYSGESVQFNASVLNTGSVDSAFSASLRTTVTGSANWVADVDITPFTLPPGATRVVPVRVFAPREAEPGERATVVLEVRSVPVAPGLRPAEFNVTLIANLAERPPPPPPPPEDRTLLPGPAPALVFAIMVFAAVASARRRRQ